MCALQFQKRSGYRFTSIPKTMKLVFPFKMQVGRKRKKTAILRKSRERSKLQEIQNEKNLGKKTSEERSGDFHAGELPQGAGKMLEDLLRRVESLEGKSGNRGESPSVNDGEIIMPGGHLKKNELIAMLNTLRWRLPSWIKTISTVSLMKGQRSLNARKWPLIGKYFPVILPKWNLWCV